MWRWVAIILGVSFSVTAFAQHSPCTRTEAKNADKAVDALISWDRIHDWYLRYQQCDDGATAEGVGEAVARNLVDRWETLPRLAGFASSDSGFWRFVLKHVDETLNDGDLKKIGANAAKRCPVGSRPLCRELKEQAEAR